MPEPRTILLRDDHPEHVVVGTRRGGYFATSDAGSSWSWLCEAGVGYEDEDVYPGALLPNGKLIVSTGFGGLASSSDGCDFASFLPSEQPFVADVRARRDARGSVVALEGRAGDEGFVNRLWQSNDGAATWQPLGREFASETQALSFDVSEAGELYVAAAGPGGAELWRSNDAGESWLRSTVAAEPGVQARVIGAHARDETTHLYVLVDHPQADGLTTRGDRVLVSLDRGATFAPLLEGEGDLAAWSLSADGERLAVGGHVDGLHVLLDAGSSDSASSLRQVSQRAVHALAWDAEGRLFAAGHEAIDGFSVGVSEDDGVTFTSFFALCQVDGPLECGESTSVGASCLSSGETGWDVRKEVPSSAACGDSGVGGAAVESHGPSHSPDMGEPPAPHDEAVSEDAASCSAAPGSGRPAGALFSMLTVLLGLRNRRVRHVGWVRRIRHWIRDDAGRPLRQMVRRLDQTS